MLHDFKPSDDGLEVKPSERRRSTGSAKNSRRSSRDVMAAKLPVVVLVEGWDCAGKGHLINELISEMAPAVLPRGGL